MRIIWRQQLVLRTVLLSTFWRQTLVVQLLYVAVIDDWDYDILAGRVPLLVALSITLIVNVARRAVPHALYPPS